MHYGIANRTGKPDVRTAHDIIETAWVGGIRYFDTAQAYGESEEVLGYVLSDLGVVNEARIITKLPPHIDYTNEKELKNALHKSLACLKCDRLFGLMFHREEVLDVFDDELVEILQLLIDKGFVEHIGISLYSPGKASQALKKNILRLLQVPANLCDHRFHREGIFTSGISQGKQIYIRSVFLQGLLLSDVKSLPPSMLHATPILNKVDLLCKKFNLSKQELCLGYIKNKYINAFVIVGVETGDQLRHNLSTWNNERLALAVDEIDGVFEDTEEKIVNPTLWTR